MGYKLREIAAESKFSQELALDAIARAVPLSEIKAALAAEAVCAQRERKLNMVMTVLVTIAMNLYARISIGAVLHKIAKGLRYIWPDPEYPVAKASAFSYRRYQVGPRPLANLFHRVCRPMATPETPGAFLCGLRLMAIDGTVEDVPDTAENVAAFGRQPGDRCGGQQIDHGLRDPPREPPAHLGIWIRQGLPQDRRTRAILGRRCLLLPPVITRMSITGRHLPCQAPWNWVKDEEQQAICQCWTSRDGGQCDLGLAKGGEMEYDKIVTWANLHAGPKEDVLCNASAFAW